MKEIGLFLFPWDLQDEGIEEVFAFAADSGVKTLYLAVSYHAGLFLHPHNPARKVYLVEDGVAYFHPRMEGFGRVQPKVAQMAADADWLDAATEQAGRFGLTVAAWTVCLHNSRIGELWPETALRDAFGTLRPYALCPAHPEVRHYLRCLVRELARYSLSSIFLEAFRYLDVVHGAHHERWSIPLPALERSLFGLSFAPPDLETAAGQGIDGERVRSNVKEHLNRFLSHYPDIPEDVPRTLEEFEARFPEAAEYRRVAGSVLDSLLSELAAEARGAGLIGQWPQGFGAWPSPHHPAFGALLRSVYRQGPEEARQTIAAARRAAAPGQRILGGVMLGFDAVRDAGELRDIVGAVEQGGADGVLFYNYSECAPKILDWIKPAVQSG